MMVGPRRMTQTGPFRFPVTMAPTARDRPPRGETMTTEHEPAPNAAPNPVHEMRLVVTADDYDAAIVFFRDVLGLPERAAYASPDGGRVVILEAGRATLEIADPAQAEFIDRVEVGRRVAGQIRVAFEVADSGATSRELVAGG